MVLTLYHFQHKRSEELIGVILHVLGDRPVGNLRRSLLCALFVDERKPVEQAYSLFLVWCSCVPVVRGYVAQGFVLTWPLVEHAVRRYIRP